MSSNCTSFSKVIYIKPRKTSENKKIICILNQYYMCCNVKALHPTEVVPKMFLSDLLLRLNWYYRTSPRLITGTLPFYKEMIYGDTVIICNIWLKNLFEMKIVSNLPYK